MTEDNLLPSTTRQAVLPPDDQLYRLLADNVTDYAIFALELNGTIASWNPGVERVLGYQESDFVGQPGAMIFTPEDRQAGVMEAEMNGAAATGRAEDDRWHLRKDGQRIWVNGVMIGLRDDAGTLVGLAKIMRDATATYRLEQERNRLLARLEAVMRQMPSGLTIVEAPSGRLLLHNDEAVRLLGHPMLEVSDYTGYMQYGALHPDGAPYIPSEYPIARALAGEVVRQEAMTYRQGDGRITHLSVSAAPLRRPDGEIEAAVSTFNDVSRTRALEDALQRANAELEGRVETRTRELRSSEARFALAVQASPVPTFILERRTLRLLEANEGVMQLTGYTLEELFGRSVAELNLFEDVREDGQLLDRLRRHADLRQTDVCVRTKTGDMRFAIMAGRLIDLEQGACLFVTLVDTTERTRTKEELRRAIGAALREGDWFADRVLEKLAEQTSEQPVRTLVAELTRRERQVLALIARGRSNEQLVTELGLARQTVHNYVSRVYEKLGVTSRAEAIVWARERGLIG